jgi:hypothetical protein
MVVVSKQGKWRVCSSGCSMPLQTLAALVWERQIPTLLPTTAAPRTVLSARTAAVEGLPHSTNCYNIAPVLSPILCLRLFYPVHRLNTYSWNPVVCLFYFRVPTFHMLREVCHFQTLCKWILFPHKCSLVLIIWKIKHKYSVKLVQYIYLSSVPKIISCEFWGSDGCEDDSVVLYGDAV